MTEPLPPNPGVEYPRPMAGDDFESPEQTSIPSFLRDPFGLLRRRWRWMLLSLVVGLLASAAFVVQMKPRYIAQATIQVTGQQIPMSLVRSTVPEGPLERINSLLGVILSRREIATLVEKHDLYPDLRESMTLADVVTRTRGDIRVEEKQRIVERGFRPQTAQLFTVSFEADRADVAAAVANDVADRITQESVRSRTRQAAMTAEFLREELERAEAELREQSQEITAFKERYRGDLPNELTANLSKMDRLQLQRQSLSLQIAEAETRLATLATTSSSPGSENATLPPETQLFALRQQLANELATRTERHPDVIALRGKIAAFEAAEADSAREEDAESADPMAPQPPPSRRSLLKTSQRTIAELMAQLAEIEKNLRILDARVANTPARQEALDALEQRESVLRESYLEFLRKVQEAELAQSLEGKQHGERFLVVDPATPPTSPTRKRWQYAGLGGLASLALSLAVGVLLEIRDPVLVSADQLTSVSDLPVLGSVPRI